MSEVSMPWKLYRTKASDKANYQDGIDWIVQTDAEWIADVSNEANAHLILAAPRLLAELKNIVGRFHSCIVHSGSDPEYADAAVKNARAAIALAEGKA